LEGKGERSKFKVAIKTIRSDDLSAPLLALQKSLARCGDGLVVVAARARGRRLGPERLARTTVERLGLWLRAFAHAE
jgi:hypothetical protein